MIAPALLLLMLLHGSAVQAHVDGAWRATYKTTEGHSHEFTLTLKGDGGGLSGTISSPRGKVDFTEGTVDGRNVAFTVTRRANYDEIDVTFKGTVEGHVMRLSMQVGPREPIAVTARRETVPQP